ncbi:MAG TPA: hypothetical protein VNW49_11840 [Puia sp.]|nr:hypothetical protein [Puia sp.]
MEQIKIVKEELLSHNWYSLKKYTYEILKDAKSILLLQYMKINQIL